MDQDQIERLIEASDLPSLLAALAHATGDPDLAPSDLWLDPARALEPEDGWDADQLKRARALVSAGLARLGASEAGEDPGPDDSLVPSLIDWLTGADLDDGYRRMLAEELAVTGDLRIPEPITLRDSPTAGATDHAVAVIGAGMSGILAAHRLKQAGVDCVVLDKNSDVGGTWLENTYPGCRVDVFNHVYSYSGEQRPDWPEYHSSQPVLLDYFRDCAQRWGIRDRIRFGVRVESLEWDGSASRSVIRQETISGTEVITAGPVVSAVGQ
ncbi:MAG: NAD(P)/FAD-dependent oxidoreductase, partial [Acidimicrobiaceae bacterium]|nr:NAD(P)/FAD-dependent oxidoreductase [Acidimicrobiaceae bacterium]